jgi:hypothetical protein
MGADWKSLTAVRQKQGAQSHGTEQKISLILAQALQKTENAPSNKLGRTLS